MKAADLKFNLIDSYLELLKNLSPERKLELITRLSDSLKGSKKPTQKSVSELYGAFISKESADEIIADLKATRNFNRKIEEL
jgi:predicted metal-binding transcription factor (methanogenesis marker protein 9)